jgi:hypothetical protein
MFVPVAALALAGSIILAASLPVLAQTPAAPGPAPGYTPDMPAPGPYEARLDELLAGRDFAGLTDAALHDVTDEEAAVRALNWLQAQQVAHGGSVYIALVYSALLWKVADSVPEPQRHGLLQTAGGELMVARWLIQAEGFQCADTSAPGARLASLDDQVPEVAQYVASAPEADKRQMKNFALTIVLKTFRNRQNDVWLCSAGIGYYNKYFAKHPDAVGKETTVPGTPGKTVVLPADPSLLPDFVAFPDWKARRRAVLDQLAKQAGVKPPTDYGDAATRLK